MSLELVLTTIFSATLAMAVVTKGLPPIAYTIPERLAVFTRTEAALGGHSGQPYALAGVRPF